MLGVAIPSRFQFDLLNKLLFQLEGREDTKVLVMDNGYTAQRREFLSSRASVMQCEGMNIHAMWNAAWSWASASGFDHLALLNDDVELGPNTLTVMEGVLRDTDYWAVSPDDHSPLDGLGHSPRQVHGTYKDYGMLGYCFMFDVKQFPEPPFDEGFEWWWGDDDFVKSVEARGGKIARIDGLGVNHVGGASSVMRPELQEAKERDLIRYNEKWEG